MSTLRREGQSVILCCGKGKCPSIKELPQDKVLITDDDKNTVVLTKAQARLINEALSQIESQ